MSNYVQSTNFATKDALSSGDPLKIVRGTEINTEFNNIATAVATKADLASPTFTGTVTGTFVGNVTGNLTGNVTGTATTLQTARNINGTSFNGSADITTANWGSSRTIWGQSINGSADITAPVRPAAGSEAAPAFSTSGDTNTGIYFPAANEIGIATNGVAAVRINEENRVLFAYPIATGSATFARVQIIARPPADFANNPFSFGLQVDQGFSAGFSRNYIAFGATEDTLQGSIVSTTGVGVQYNTSSDYRLKDNIRPLSGGLDRVMRLKPCEWNWKINGSAGVGFIAHEVQAERPQAVSGEKDGVNADGLPVYQGMDASYLVADLTAAIQELKALVDAQAVEIAVLKQQM